MIYKESKENLLKENLIKKCPIDHRAILSLIKRAYLDLKTAKRNLAEKMKNVLSTMRIMQCYAQGLRLCLAKALGRI